MSNHNTPANLYAVALSRAGYVNVIGDIDDLADFIRSALAHVGIAMDDEDTLSGVRVLVDDWYDAADPDAESPHEFAERLFDLAETQLRD